ncbi:lipid IV(A) 4-amino-4-deoxy-L-arabinosyltransferase [Atlantibacter hermannii]|uniref:lipid IV(A) 4-amino-4-deoxy-L-arabinosyltransferase n=1 Tax=Atlantibacter hermannii TaxID=565 RepID=UPI00289EA057|nr:lipid IV(A) 4-amino-4-deoxy-L-arabinosyltransferase [Atlantibacter hermannii]
MTKPVKIVLLIALFALYYLIPVEFRALWQPDETRYAEISREMLVNGNWITPHFLDVRYFEKPIAGYWINSLGQWVFGHNNFGVRAGAIVSTTLTAVLVYWLGMRLFNQRRVALIASVIFLTSLLVYGVGTYAVLDPVLALWLMASMCSFWLATEAKTTSRRLMGYALLGVACALGFMTKGFLALAVPVLAILPWSLWQKRIKELLLFGPVAIGVAVLASAPWALAIYHQQPDFWHYFFWVEHIQRFAQADAQHNAPFWYYLPIFLLGSLPWLGLLPGALLTGWRANRASPGPGYLLCWVVMPLLFFSLANGKLPTYILPCFAPLALLLAHYGTSVAPATGRMLNANGWINAGFGGLVTLALLTVLAPWSLVGRPLYGYTEIFRFSLAVFAFASWGIIGVLSVKPASHRWMWAALCPLGVALTLSAAIPERIRDAKQPQSFVGAVANRMSASRYVLANGPGVASQIAWSLRRSDILLYAQQGELRYGLSYPDAQHKYVSREAFGQWLAEHRREGNVSLVLLQSSVDDPPDVTPPPDFVWRQGRLIYLEYDRIP